MAVRYSGRAESDAHFFHPCQTASPALPTCIFVLPSVSLSHAMRNLTPRRLPRWYGPSPSTTPSHPIILGIPPTALAAAPSSRSCPRLSLLGQVSLRILVIGESLQPWRTSRRLMLMPIDFGVFVPSTPTNLTPSWSIPSVWTVRTTGPQQRHTGRSRHKRLHSQTARHPVSTPWAAVSCSPLQRSVSTWTSFPVYASFAAALHPPDTVFEGPPSSRET